MNILSLIEHRDKAPTNALIAHSVRACAARGIPQLVYQRFAYGNKQPDGIMKFKQVNGFERATCLATTFPSLPLAGLLFAWDYTAGWSTIFPHRCETSCASSAAPGIAESSRQSRNLPRIMPGIVGLITSMPRERAEHELSGMVEALRHESFYVAGTHANRIWECT